MTYHQILGHPSFQTLKCMFFDEFKGFCIEFFFVISMKEKSIRENHNHTKIQRDKKNPFQLIHYDTKVLAPSTDIHHFKWVLIFLDDFSTFTWINLLKLNHRFQPKSCTLVK